MAKPRPTEHAPPAGGPFPDVAHERRDIDVATVFWSGIGFAILAASSTGFAVWLSVQLLREPPPARNLGLPASVADANQRPPKDQPFLEAIEDLDRQTDEMRKRRKGKPEERDEPLRAELLPPRAAWHRKAHPAPELPPVDSLKLKARKDATATPRFYSAILPSKASAGRTETGGDQ